MKNIKTILHIIDTTGPGGAETVFIDLIVHLRQEYRSIVMIRAKGWVYEELCRRGVKPILLDAKGSFNWRYLRQLIDFIRKEKVDLIQSHLLGSNVYCALAGLLTNRPVVATFHGQVDIGINESLKGLKFAVLNWGASAIIVVSDNLRQNIMSRTTLKQRKIRVIYNGIDTAEFQHPRSDALRKQFGWDKSDVIVGSLGNIRTAKGYDVLLSAAALLKDKSVNYRFVIAGEGKPGLFDDLIRMKKEQGLDATVYFLGFHDDPAEFLSNLNIFLLSSISEGFSIATIQAMVSGLPVIATRSGGPQEILSHNQTGWLVDPGKPELIAEAIERLSADSELSQRLAVAGKRHAIEMFDIKSMIGAYEETYQACI